MKLLAFDLGSHKTGWAIGSPGCARPTISVWRVRKSGASREEAVAEFSCRLRDLLDIEASVEKIAVEKYLDPAAQPETEQILSSLLMHGALRGIAATYAIPIFEAAVAEIRVHFIGRSTAVPRTRRGEPPRSTRQKRLDREATKDLVWKQAVLLGYFDRGETPSWDRSDAVAVWDWAAATLCRAQRAVRTRSTTGVALNRPQRALELRRFERLVRENRRRRIVRPEGRTVCIAETIVRVGKGYTISRAPVSVPRVRWMERPI